MANLTRWDPFREMLSMREMVDRLMDAPFTRNDAGSWPQSLNLPLDVIEEGERYIVKASAPGIQPEDLEITYNDRMLTIKGEVKEEKAGENAQVHWRERRFGRFSRSITLPAPVKAGDIEARYESGVLILSLPKADEARPQRISIKTDKVIEG